MLTAPVHLIFFEKKKERKKKEKKYDNLYVIVK